MIAVFWDDLDQSGDNRVYHLVRRRTRDVYVVQWSRMRNRLSGMQNCEVILYDPAVHPTATGDGLMVFQYDQVTNNDTSRGYATVGIQDHQDGLNYTYYNRYANGARTLQSGRAIAFVPTPPAALAVAAVSPGSVSAILVPGETRAHPGDQQPGRRGVAAHLAAGGQGPSAAKGGRRRRQPRSARSPCWRPTAARSWPIGQNRTVQWEQAVTSQP